MSGSHLTFLAMAALTVAGSLGVVFMRRPVHAAVSLVLVFFVLGFMYMTLGAQLLGITQIMVYAGAIMVLFLFVVMMLRQADQGNGVVTTDWRLTAALAGGLVLAASIVTAVFLPLSQNQFRLPDASVGTPAALGYSLFAEYAWPFEVVSILLLVGIVGSIMLAKRRI